MENFSPSLAKQGKITAAEKSWHTNVHVAVFSTITFIELRMKPSIRSLEKKAQQLRSLMASRLSEEDASSTMVTSEGHSHFALYGGRLPLESGLAAIGFNNYVTDRVINDYVLHETDPYIVAFLGSKVIEQTFINIFDQRSPSKPLNNLSVAKHYGTFFTPPQIAEVMYRNLKTKRKAKHLIDPCLGGGVLLASALLYEENCHYDALIGIELDTNISDWTRLILNRISELVNYTGQITVIQGNGLEFLLDGIDNKTWSNYDVIINPPYGRLRITKDRTFNAETALSNNVKSHTIQAAELHSSVTKDAETIRERYAEFLDERGILEYSRVFYKACAKVCLKGANVSIITPDSWMSGHEGQGLRKELVQNRLISEIHLIKEGGKEFSTVNQSTSISLLTIEEKEYFSVSDFFDEDNKKNQVAFSDISSAPKAGYAIPRLSDETLDVFKKLSTYNTFNDQTWIINARGEVDQTAQSSFFVEEATAIPLVRGEHVERHFFRHSSSSKKPSFLLKAEFSSFISGRPKRVHFEKHRIVGRQCSYAQQTRRLIFCHIPPKHAVGNSCNYLVIDADTKAEQEKRTYLILGLLNSAVLDWFFKVQNSNNHVGNYEIDAFPFPVDNTWFDLISTLSSQMEKAKSNGANTNVDQLSELLEAVVGLAYSLSIDSELKPILNRVKGCNTERVVNYARHLLRNVKFPKHNFGDGVFNHANPTLSDLDRLIILHVPEGGNWQNIPETVPSERLKQIREMTAERGVVRTTYYGRLRRDQPAYTINTYFNRPGNGTHIHPSLDRTLTSREAARLQSFPDHYIFLGSDGAVRDQIGNAVPPLLAAAIGRKFIQYAKSKTCVDIFCGAGGLSLGLESVGWNVVAAIDNNREALDTYCFNRPCDLEPLSYRSGHTAVLKRDLQNRDEFEFTVDQIQMALGGQSLDLLVGGPPCQGFSHAGFRLSDDKRNDLASIYLHFAERLRPRIFMLENVEGLATFNKGQVLQDICKTLSDLGYRVHQPVWKLCSEQYGVPQMRRRVFVVATIDESIDLSPPTPEYERCAGRREKGLNDLFTAVLPPPFTVSDALSGLSLPDKKCSKLNCWLTTGLID